MCRLSGGSLGGRNVAVARVRRKSGGLRRRKLARLHHALTASSAITIVPRAGANGAVAQLGERDVRNVEVRGSIPLCSTILLRAIASQACAGSRPGPAAQPPDSSFIRALPSARLS